MKRTKYYRPANRDYMNKRNELLVPLIMTLVSVAMLASVSSKACDEIYLKAGAGYKFSETDSMKMRDGRTAKLDIHSPISARIEIGKQHGNWSYGVSHHSQWLVGWPLDDRKEYNKTEAFIDYKWGL